MKNYTSGPWKYKAGQDYEIYGHGYRLAVLKGGEALRNKYNAILISCAPELLEALEWYVDNHPNDEWQNENYSTPYKEIVKLIAKAKGEGSC